MSLKLEKHTHIKPLEDIMSEGFGKYAKYIIQDRALPDIRDGLKPVQRRIIYAMNNLQLFYDRPHKKSARTVGEVIGKYHPHGDSSIYEAMVRMSQEWKNNIPLLDMHGNNGSIDGDSAAAMRYTECRLSKFGQQMVENIKKNTVKFINNFDDSEEEPTVLPTILPNLLINGVSGIAAGYATNIPTFNPTEVIDAIVHRIDDPECTIKEILKIMPGPDFPTGGIVLNREGVLKAYESGKGKITIRGVIKLNGNKATITEIPYETNKAQIIRDIDRLRQEFEILNITEVRDETDKNGIVIAIDFKKTDNFEFVKNFLYKNTQLQISYNLNMVAIKDRKPYQMPMLFIIDSFIEHIDQIISKSTKFDLDKAIQRKEVVVGIIKAIKMLDDVINTIRRSENKANAKQSLITKMMFTENQAEAIVNLRLYRLSSADVGEMNKELQDLEKQINELSLILENKEIRNNFIKNKLRENKEIFGFKRKTRFSNDDEKIIIEQTDVVEDKEQIIIATRDGYLKNIPIRSFASSEYNDLMLKEKDLPVGQFISNQRDKVVLITNRGNYVSVPTHKIEIAKWKEMGTHLNNYISIDPEEKILFAFNFENNPEDGRNLIMISKDGDIKRTDVKSLNISKLTKISKCFNLGENDSVVACFIVNDPTNERVCVVSQKGINLVFPIEQISIVSKNAGGVKSLSLKEDDKIGAAFNYKKDTENYVAICCDKGIKRFQKSEFNIGNRGNVGRQLFVQNVQKNIQVIGAFEMEKDEVIQGIDEKGKWKIININEVPLMTQGSKFVSSHADNFLYVRKIKLLNNNNSQGEKTSLFDDEK